MAAAVSRGDRLLHQADLDARAHIAQDDLDQVLGFERRGPSQQIQRELLFGSRLSGARDRRKGFRYFRQFQGRHDALPLQQVLRGAAQVAVAQVGGMHRGLGGSG